MVAVSDEWTSCPGLGAAEPAEGNHFVAAYPPFSCWRDERVDVVRKLLETPALPVNRAPFGLYVHVPFCAHRCQYCYYLSYEGRTHRQIDQYVESLVQELALYGRAPAFAGRKVGFVYFGGGTPSLLSAESIRRLLSELKAVFPWTAAEEVTFECAPRSTTRRRLDVLREAGVNRLSLGVQQLDDEVLHRNNRVHLVADVERAWAEVRASDFDEVNVDLITGLVGETGASFRASLERVIRMDPDSVTVYQLEIPHHTPLARSLRDGTLVGALPTWAEKRTRLAYAFTRLQGAGYALRSAYAAAKNTRHRRFAYQEEQYRGADLLGIGASAFSYFAGAHFQNVASLESYLAEVGNGRLPVGRAYLLSDAERLVREFVLQLKLGRVEARRFRDKFGVEIGERFAGPLEHFADRGWLTYDSHGVRLTREGLLRVDLMIPAFYLPEHQGLRYS
jgi:oxygen-independent coproporphyrinogen-3 oxidase